MKPKELRRYLESLIVLAATIPFYVELISIDLPFSANLLLTVSIFAGGVHCFFGDNVFTTQKFRRSQFSENGVHIGCVLVPFVTGALTSWAFRNPSGAMIDFVPAISFFRSSLFLSSFVFISLMIFGEPTPPRHFLKILSGTALAVTIWFFSYDFQNVGLHSFILAFVFVGLLETMYTNIAKSFTLGEMIIVIEAISLFVYDGIELFFQPEMSAILEGPARRPVDVLVIQQGLTIGVLFFGQILAVILKVLKVLSPSVWLDEKKQSTAYHVLRNLSFFASLLFVYLCVCNPITARVLGEDVNTWIWQFSFSEPRRIFFVFYWFWVLLISLTLLYFYHKSIELILLRKLFHILTLVLFIPVMLVDAKFLALSFGTAGTLLILSELMRMWQIWPFSKYVSDFMRKFTDSRDEGPFILTHLYLLFGCAIPLWFSDFSIISDGIRNYSFPFSGFIVLGIGDTAASFFGRKYGKTKWPGTSKTLEGTTGAILSTLIVTPMFISFTSRSLRSFLIATLLTFLLEGLTVQIDNLILPLFFFSIALTLS